MIPVAVLVLQLAAAAQDAAPAPQPLCSVELSSIDKALLEQATSSVADASGYSGDASNPAFLLAPMRNEDEGSFHTAMFAKGDKGWQVFSLGVGRAVQYAGINPVTHRAVVVTMHESEGPGQEYEVMTMGMDARPSCTVVPFPAELNSQSYMMEYLSLTFLIMDGQGQGMIAGHAEWQDKPETWFTYATSDGGQTWQPPQKHTTLPAPPASVMIEDSAAPVQALLDEIKARAAR